MFESAESNAHPVVGGFVWSRIARPRLTPSQIADKGRRSVRRLAEWKVPVQENCRLMRSIHRLEESPGDPEGLRRLDDRARHIMGESARTVFDLYIATHCRASEPSVTVKAKFAQAITGADAPEHEEAHSARDVQFELYVWGMINASGGACDFAEPDLVCGYGGGPAGIAAKRIWSQEQARKRLSEAASQIASSGRRGFIAINAQEYLTADAGVTDLAAKGQAISDALNRLHGHLPYIAKKEQVLGLFIGGTVYRWGMGDDGSVGFELTVMHQWLFPAEPGPDEDVAQRFGTEQENGLAKWMVANL